MGMLQLRAKDGHSLSAYMVAPEGKPRGGVVVIQEIFGLNSHIKRVTEQYAGLGYLAVAPALFDRIKRNVELPYTDLQPGIDLMTKTTNDGVLADVNAAVDSVAHAGRTGIVGYCWGGRVTYLSACRINLAAAVAYYGGPQLGAIYGFTAGIAIDCFLTTPMGLSALSFALVGYGVGALQTGQVQLRDDRVVGQLPDLDDRWQTS